MTGLNTEIGQVRTNVTSGVRVGFLSVGHEKLEKVVLDSRKGLQFISTTDICLRNSYNSRHTGILFDGCEEWTTSAEVGPETI